MSALYKFTGPGGTSHGGFRWPLPTADGQPGEWVDLHPWSRKALAEGDLCTPRVLHLADAAHLLDWLNAEMWEAEADESRGIVRGPDKVGVRRARLVRRVDAWNERTARVFACDCAEDALRFIPDDASRLTCEAAIYTVRCFADGAATREDLAAAGDAARAAAGDAAGDAARAAARAAAWAAARDAAGDAARAAAWAAAWDAAWAAAGDAAWAAAWDRHNADLCAMLGIGGAS